MMHRNIRYLSEEEESLETDWKWRCETVNADIRTVMEGNSDKCDFE
jgi:hypothetical protein